MTTDQTSAVPSIIIFDFGGVLGSDANEWRTTFANILTLTGLSAENLEELWRMSWPALKVGKGGLESFWEEVATISKTQTTGQELMEEYVRLIRIDEETMQIARELEENYLLAILANESRAGMDAKVQRFSLLEVFTKVYGSAHIGLAKPDPQAFEFVLRDLDAKPEEVLFIDNQQNNIDAATAMGMQAIRFVSAAQLRRELRSRDVLSQTI